MHPYRDPPPSCAADERPAEERVLYTLCVAIGSIPVLAGHGFGVNATLGSLMVLAGLCGLRSLRRP